MLKYKVGDEVLVRAKIFRVDETAKNFPYRVELRDVEGGMWISAEEVDGFATAVEPAPTAPPSATITVGAVVRLKCGGPAMVVEEINDSEYTCTWHNNDGNVQCWVIPGAILEIVR